MASKDDIHRTRIIVENGYCESFNSKMRDEFLSGEIFYSIKELLVLADHWRKHTTSLDRARHWATGHQHQKPGWHPLLGDKGS